MSEETAKVEEGTIQGFDYRSIIRDPRTGKTIKEQHYIRHVSQAHGEYLERDGKFYYPNGMEMPNPKLPKEEVTVVEKPQAEMKVEKKTEVLLTKKA